MFSKAIHSFKSNLVFIILIDSLIIIFSFYFSILTRFELEIPSSIISLISVFNTFCLVFVKIVAFYLMSLYKGMWRYTSVWDIINIAKANLLSSTLLIILAYYATGFQNISRSLFFIDFIICYGLISVYRLGIRVFFSHLKDFIFNEKLINKKNIILLGAGDSGEVILKEMQRSNSKFRVVAFLDDDKKKIGRRIHGVSIIGSFNHIPYLNVDYDELYICIPSANRKQMQRIIQECKKSKKPFKTLPSMKEIMEGKVSLSQFREVSLTDLIGREEVVLDEKSIKRFIRGKRILITGSGGSIGSELVRQCSKFSPSIILMLDISEYNLFEINLETQNSNPEILFKPILADIKEYNVIHDIFEQYKPQVVFHAAAYKHVPLQEYFPQEAVKTNIYGTVNLADISIKHNVEKFVLVSTDKAVRPTNVMGATKRLAEIYLQKFNLDNNSTSFIAVRFGNVLGSSGSVIPIFQKQIKLGGPLTITDPNMERYFMSIPEASQLILQSGALGRGGEVFILDMGKPIKIIDIAEELIHLSGYVPNVDIQISVTGRRPGEKKIEELSLPTEILEETTHKKIFVLNDQDISDDEILKIINKTKNLKTKINEHQSPDQIRLILSSILPEYAPNIIAPNEKFLKEDAAKA